MASTHRCSCCPLLLLLLLVLVAAVGAFDLHQAKPVAAKLVMEATAAAPRRAAAEDALTVPTATIRRLRRRGRGGAAVDAGAALKAALLAADAAPLGGPSAASSAAAFLKAPGAGGAAAGAKDDLAELLHAQPLLRRRLESALAGNLEATAAAPASASSSDIDEPTPASGAAGTAEVGNFEWGRVANISIGSPPRPHLLYVSLSNADFWVFHRMVRFDERLLARPKQPYRDDLSHTSDVTQRMMPIMGGHGIVLMARDTVSVGAASVKNVTFGAAVLVPEFLMDDDYVSFPVDGIFGLSLNPMREKFQTPVQSFVAGLPQPTFTIYQKPNVYNMSAEEGITMDGALTFGGENAADCSAGAYRYTNYTLNRDMDFAPETVYRGARVVAEDGGAIHSPPRKAVFVDGLGIYLRYAEARAIAERIGGKPFGRGGRYFRVDCEQVKAGRMPPVSLLLGDDATGPVELTFRHYTFSVGEDLCLLMFVGAHSSQQTPVVVGIDSLQNKCLANNVRDRRLGFADGA